jgi:hypothetical protein
MIKIEKTPNKNLFFAKLICCAAGMVDSHMKNVATKVIAITNYQPDVILQMPL